MWKNREQNRYCGTRAEMVFSALPVDALSSVQNWKAATYGGNPSQSRSLFHTQLSGPGIETMDWSTWTPPLGWLVLAGGRASARGGSAPGAPRGPVRGSVPGSTVLGRVPSLACPARGRVPSFVCRTVPSDFGVCGDALCEDSGKYGELSMPTWNSQQIC